MDQIFTLAKLLRGSWGVASPVYKRFKHLKKDYDHVPRDILGADAAWGWSLWVAIKSDPVLVLPKQELSLHS